MNSRKLLGATTEMTFEGDLDLPILKVSQTKVKIEDISQLKSGPETPRQRTGKPITNLKVDMMNSLRQYTSSIGSLSIASNCDYHNHYHKFTSNGTNLIVY